MNTEAQRIAIAEACGWRAEHWASGCWMLYSPNGDRMSDCGAGTRESVFDLYSPDYLSDLNAMHEAEKVLNEKQEVWYLMNLMKVQELPGTIGTRADRTFKSTAAQRAEAFLRTLNLWPV